MIMRRGASLLATIGTLVLGAGALGAAGYTMMTGDCASCCSGGTCSDTQAAVVNVADTKEEGGSCCALGAIAQTGAIADEQSDCESSCCGDKAKAQVIAASNEGGCCGDKASSFSAPTVLAASYPIMMPTRTFAAKAVCGSSCGSSCTDNAKAQTIAASNAKGACCGACADACCGKCDSGQAKTIAASNTEKASCASACGSSCSDNKATTMAAVLRWTVKPGIIRPASMIKTGSCGSSCGGSCSGAAVQPAAATQADDGCCGGSGERADGKPCCGQCTDDNKDEAAEPVASAN